MVSPLSVNALTVGIDTDRDPVQRWVLRFERHLTPSRTQISAPTPLVFEGFSELSHCFPGVVGVDGCLGELLVAIELGADEPTLGVE